MSRVRELPRLLEQRVNARERAVPRAGAAPRAGSAPGGGTLCERGINNCALPTHNYERGPPVICNVVTCITVTMELQPPCCTISSLMVLYFK